MKTNRWESRGASLVYSTFLGGDNDDYAAAIAVNAMGEAYVAGSTFSLAFPATRAIQVKRERSSSDADAFVVRLYTTMYTPL